MTLAVTPLSFPGARLERRLLQLTIAVGCLVPILAGGAGMLMGPAMVHGAGPVIVDLDSHFRYLSGLLFGIGLLYASTIAHIEARGYRFLVLTLIVAAGGLGRLCSILLTQQPSTAMVLALAMELGVTPLLLLWQRRVARRFGTR